MMLVGVVMLMLGIDCAVAAVKNARPAPWKGSFLTPNERYAWIALAMLFLVGGASLVIRFLSRLLHL
jgi:hypothetical protein